VDSIYISSADSKFEKQEQNTLRTTPAKIEKGLARLSELGEMLLKRETTCSLNNKLII
jgi:hypothetical protein